MTVPAWDAAAAIFEAVKRAADREDIRITPTGPFDAKGPIWIVVPAGRAGP